MARRLRHRRDQRQLARGRRSGQWLGGGYRVKAENRQAGDCIPRNPDRTFLDIAADDRIGACPAPRLPDNDCPFLAAAHMGFDFGRRGCLIDRVTRRGKTRQCLACHIRSAAALLTAGEATSGVQMQRRHLLAGTAALAARPMFAQATIGGASKTLVFVPTTNPPSFDPVWNPAQATRTLGLMIYETLYTRDMALNPHPHMLDGHLIEDDGKRWTMTLRVGQTFHDGTPVLARDCVASIRRWMVRDPIGTYVNGRLDALEAADDRTIVWRLKKSFPFLAAMLAKTQPTCAMMPERLAADPYKQAAECVGSGPFRWVANEFVSGSRAVMAKFDRYVPRQEKVEYGWGGYHVKVDRVEWRIIPDAATAAGALATGEVDWVENPLPDLLPMLRKAPGVTVGRLDTHGVFPVLRPNFIVGPTANPVVRRAMLAAINQTDEMTAVMGDDREGWRAPVGFFVPGTESANDSGMEVTRNRP